MSLLCVLEPFVSFLETISSVKSSHSKEKMDMIDENFLQHAVDASMVDMVDEKVLVVLRDGRHLLGALSSFDQFANIVLENCVERDLAEEALVYAEEKRGLMCVRGENISMVSLLVRFISISH